MKKKIKGSRLSKVGNVDGGAIVVVINGNNNNVTINGGNGIATDCNEADKSSSSKKTEPYVNEALPNTTNNDSKESQNMTLALKETLECAVAESNRLKEANEGLQEELTLLKTQEASKQPSSFGLICKISLAIILLIVMVLIVFACNISLNSSFGKCNAIACKEIATIA